MGIENPVRNGCWYLDRAGRSHNFRNPRTANFLLAISMEVESDMKQILISRFQIAKDVITSEAEFKKDLGLDSLDVMELVIELENVFNIHIADEDAASILTFGDAVTCVQAGIRP